MVRCVRCNKEHYRSGSELGKKEYFCSLPCRNYRTNIPCIVCKKPLLVKRGRANRKYLLCSIACRKVYKTNEFRNPELREKMRKLGLGRKQSEATVQKRVAKLIGQKRNPEQKLRIRLAIPKGKDNHSWRGGISPIAYRLRRSLEMGLWRKQVFERDDYICQDCGERGGFLHAHHIVEFSTILQVLLQRCGNSKLFFEAMNDSVLWDVKNGITLCVKCHKLMHLKRAKGRKNDPA